MSASVLYMSMSLDGYIAGPNDEPANPGGDGFDRLHEWIVGADGKFGRPPGPAGQLWDEWNASGAVLAGRRTASRSITGAVIVTVSRSSWSVIGRRVPRWRAIRW